MGRENYSQGDTHRKTTWVSPGDSDEEHLPEDADLECS
jgi:hypothetical protein